ncbi:hypothetical protein YC2023_117797 [Brassica napus]
MFDLVIHYETYQKSLAEHQNPDTLKRLNEADRAKKICRINSISIPLLVRRSVKKVIWFCSSILVKRVILTSFCVCNTGNKLFKEQEYHDAVRHHTEAIQRNPKEPTTRPRGMQDPGIKNILTDL